MEPEEKVSGSRSSLILVLVLVAAIAAAGYFAYQYYSLRQNPTIAAQEEVKNLVSQVGKLIDLPNEQPTIATVVDAEALRSQAFFAKAEKGDKVLIYPNAKKAYLYSPALNKIIEVGPVVIGSGATQAPAPTPVEITPSPTPKK